MNTSGKRDPLDRWYTPEAAARVMMRHVLTRPPERWFYGYRIVDPACGDGAFVRAAVVAAAHFDRRYKIVTWDLDPEVGRPVGSDQHHAVSFLTATREDLEGAIVATNPPFSLAEDFVRHSLDHGAASVSLLLPLSFRGSEARIPLWRNLAEVALMRPRITYGGPARDAKIAEAAARNRKYADSANGDSAVFTWRPGHFGPAALVDLPSWRE